MSTFRVNDQYPVFIGDIGADFPAWLSARRHSNILILCDENTRECCLPEFREKTGLKNAPSVEIPAGEKFKTLETCSRVWNELLSQQIDRKGLVVNLGGGVVGDLGGFCAATWKRGIDFVQVPTTLLSMTDAAIGGKLGVDFEGIKNTVGVFQNPAGVWIDPVWLKTLPDRELRSGIAEIIKHALIGDPALWKFLQYSPEYRSWEWTEVLKASVGVKIRVVNEDPYEKNIRAVLNFGHTVGHALESVYLETETPLTHGEAVAFGMLCEVLIAEKKGFLTADSFENISKTTARYFPPFSIPDALIPDIWKKMGQDKKNAEGAVRMAVPGEAPFSWQMIDLRLEDVAEGLSDVQGK